MKNYHLNNSYKILQDPLSLPCRHHICKKCLKDDTNTQCPICNIPYWQYELQYSGIIHDIINIFNTTSDTIKIKNIPIVSSTNTKIKKIYIATFGFTIKENSHLENYCKINGLQQVKNIYDTNCTHLLVKPITKNYIYIYDKYNIHTNENVNKIISKYSNIYCEYHDEYVCRNIIKISNPNIINDILKIKLPCKDILKKIIEYLKNDTFWDIYQTYDNIQKCINYAQNNNWIYTPSTYIIYNKMLQKYHCSCIFFLLLLFQKELKKLYKILNELKEELPPLITTRNISCAIAMVLNIPIISSGWLCEYNEKYIINYFTLDTTNLTIFNNNNISIITENIKKSTYLNINYFLKNNTIVSYKNLFNGVYCGTIPNTINNKNTSSDIQFLLFTIGATLLPIDESFVYENEIKNIFLSVLYKAHKVSSNNWGNLHQYIDQLYQLLYELQLSSTCFYTVVDYSISKISSIAIQQIQVICRQVCYVTIL